ncbi:hypothetical protein V6U90_32490 [Micromonospora sp. CPCC 206060]|uniref:hypothetical protein n=1 Tax=Micromonospora sp. CPCC 206060 TaxID=3122406 RepID=UPI002FEF706D
MTKTVFQTLAALGVAAVAASAIPAASPATATTQTQSEASVTGSARVFYSPAPDDDVRFTFDAHAVSPTTGQIPHPADAQGTVRVYHRVAALNLTLWAEGEVNCVMTSGRAATLTAIVTKTSPELSQSWMGKHLGFTVFDGGDDESVHSLDQMGSTGPVENLAKCMAGNPNAPVMAPAPFFTVQSGGYRVEPA